MKITIAILGNWLLIVISLYFSYQLLTSANQWIFLDNLNLFIHEAGHFLFMPFGQFISILAGSLFQILFPVCFLIYFLNRRDFFAASFILFWIADNIINVSRYMKDATTMRLPLLGGDNAIHDWHWLFTNLGVLSQTEFIATTVFILGVIVLIAGIGGMMWFTVIKMKENDHSY